MKLNYRVLIFIAAAIFGLVLSAPSLLNLEKGSKITLGLDLQGGLHMLLGVDTDEAIRSKIKSLASSIKYAAEDEDLIIDEFKVRDGKISFELLDKDDMPKMDEILKKIQRKIYVSEPLPIGDLPIPIEVRAIMLKHEYSARFYRVKR